MAGEDGLPTAGRHVGIGRRVWVDVTTHRRGASGRGVLCPAGGLVVVRYGHGQPMACSTRNPERNMPIPMAVAVATPPMTMKAVSRTMERIRCHQRRWARRPVTTRRGGWNQTPRRAPGLQDRSIAYSTSPDGAMCARPAWSTRPGGKARPAGRSLPVGQIVVPDQPGWSRRVAAPDQALTMAGWTAPGGNRRDIP